MSTTAAHPRTEAIARACYRAYVDKDRSAIEALLAPDFRFTSPLDNALDRDTYLRRCWPNSQRTASFELVSIVPDGDERVFVVYEATTTDGRRFRNAERLTVHGNQLAEVEVYFGWNLPHGAEAGGFVESSGDAANDDREIRELVRGWMEATQRGDVDRVLEMMTDDAVFLVPGQQPMGRAQFERQARALAGIDGLTIAGSSQIEELTVCGDWAFARNHLTVTMTPRNGPPQRREGYAMTLFRKQRSTWRLARDANLLAPPG